MNVNFFLCHLGYLAGLHSMVFLAEGRCSSLCCKHSGLGGSFLCLNFLSNEV